MALSMQAVFYHCQFGLYVITAAPNLSAAFTYLNTPTSGAPSLKLRGRLLSQDVSTAANSGWKSSGAVFGTQLTESGGKETRKQEPL